MSIISTASLFGHRNVERASENTTLLRREWLFKYISIEETFRKKLDALCWTA